MIMNSSSSATGVVKASLCLTSSAKLPSIANAQPISGFGRPRLRRSITLSAAAPAPKTFIFNYSDPISCGMHAYVLPIFYYVELNK